MCLSLYPYSRRFVFISGHCMSVWFLPHLVSLILRSICLYNFIIFRFHHLWERNYFSDCDFQKNWSESGEKHQYNFVFSWLNISRESQTENWCPFSLYKSLCIPNYISFHLSFLFLHSLFVIPLEDILNSVTLQLYLCLLSF